MSEAAKDEAELIEWVANNVTWYSHHYYANARSALAAIRAAGWAVVPVEPTDEMFEAGHEEVLGDSGVIATYRAMIAAAPGVKP
jgi:hypothetical protein